MSTVVMSMIVLAAAAQVLRANAAVGKAIFAVLRKALDGIAHARSRRRNMYGPQTCRLGLRELRVYEVSGRAPLRFGVYGIGLRGIP